MRARGAYATGVRSQHHVPAYRQPIGWMARLRTRHVQRATFLMVCSSAIVAYCAATFREEYFWIFLLGGACPIAGAIALRRAWAHLGLSFDATWRVDGDGAHWTFGTTSGSLTFAQIDRVEVRSDRVVIHMKPNGTNEIAAGSPGFDELCSSFRAECDRAGVRVVRPASARHHLSRAEATLGAVGAATRHLLARPWELLVLVAAGLAIVVLRVAEMALGLLLQLRLVLGVALIGPALALFGYYLVVLAWPALLIGLAVGTLGALAAGASARAKIRAAIVAEGMAGFEATVSSAT